MSTYPSEPSDDELHFHQRKSQIAAELQRGRDLSPKGSLDAPILELIEFLNTLPGYYTTSSCSGRVSIFQHRLSKSKGGEWLLIKHDRATWEEVKEALGKIHSPTTAGSSTPNDSAGDVVLRFEPFILAVECRSLQEANTMLSVAMACGFRESGLSAAQKRFILSVRSSVRLEVPIWSARGDDGSGGKMLVGDEYLKFLLQTANEKYDKNIAKIARFDAAVKKEFGSNVVESMTKPKFYNAFEQAANARGTSSAPSTSSSSSSTSKSKLTPHALFNRQQRVLTGLESLEKRLDLAAQNLERVRKGEKIVVDEKLQGKTAAKATRPTTSHILAAPASSSKPISAKASSAAASSNPSSSAASPSVPLIPCLFVPRSQTKIVKDALTQRKWIDVKFKIVGVEGSTQQEEENGSTGVSAASSSSSLSLMRIPLIPSAGDEIHRVISHAKKAYVRNDLIKQLLGIDATAAGGGADVDVEFRMVSEADMKSGTNTCASSSSALLPPTTPPRVRLLHLLRQSPLFSHIPVERLEKILPNKWEKLGEDFLIWPAGSWSEPEWSESKKSTVPNTIPPLWSLVMQAFRGAIWRMAISHEVAAADVLRSSQVELVVSGEESDHPQRDIIAKRPPEQRLGWVVHKENGVLYNFDTTKVMFSSGNGTEKRRIVHQVLEENIAERLEGENNNTGETIVDLYAGIGYFTLPLLVHTAVPSVKPTASGGASSSSSTTTSQPHYQPHSKLSFLHACELNPHSLDSLRRNIALNRIAPERAKIHPGDNRAPELVQELSCLADRISLGLLPSAEDTYHVALKVLKSRGGVLHIHANIPDAAREKFATAVQAQLRLILLTDPILLNQQSEKQAWEIKAFRITTVKPYAPRVSHVVADVACFPKDSPWWKKQEEWEERQKNGQENVTSTKDPKLQDSKKTISTSTSTSAATSSTSSFSDSLPVSIDSSSSTTASSDPSLWYPYPFSIPVVHSPSYEQFREIVAKQEPVVLRGIDLGNEWSKVFTPQGLLDLSSKGGGKSSAHNPLVTVHVSPHTSRMDFLQRNYMFKQMKLKEMIERMIRIGRDVAPIVVASNVAPSHSPQQTPRTAEAPSIAIAETHAPSSSSRASASVTASSTKPSDSLPAAASSSAASPSSSATITRDSYFISPHEIYYLRSLGTNPKTEVANFWSSFPELAKKIQMPRVRNSSTGEWIPLLSPEKVFSSIFRVSSPGLQLWTHYDVTDNLLLHLHSLKRVVIFPPECAEGLGLKREPDASSSPILDIDAAPSHSSPSGWSDTQKQHGRQVILLPGDILFLPALWFHNVTSLNKSKFLSGYSSLVSPEDAVRMKDCEDICISLNLFWKELPSSEYQQKDLYGNKDLLKGITILNSAKEMASSLEGLPDQYAQFYGLRAQAILQKQAQRIAIVRSPVTSGSSLAKQISLAQDIQPVQSWLRTLLPESRKILAHITHYVTHGSIAGDQGLNLPSKPVLYRNTQGAPKVSILFYGPAETPEVLARARDPHKAITLASDLDWRNAPTSFYVAWYTAVGDAEAEKLLEKMLEEILPTYEPFFFSCLPKRYESLMSHLAKKRHATLHWNPASVWQAECETVERVTDNWPEEHRRLLREARSGKTVAPPAVASSASATSSSTLASTSPAPVSSPQPTPSPPPSLGSNVVIAPLRDEHVDLVVKNWPWASPSAAPLIRQLIQSEISRCVYIDGEPACWSISKEYLCIGFLHTQPAFRGRGLAALVVQAMSEAMLDARPNEPIFGEVTHGNVASERVFIKCGFKRNHDVFWVQWVPAPNRSAH